MMNYGQMMSSNGFMIWFCMQFSAAEVHYVEDEHGTPCVAKAKAFFWKAKMGGQNGPTSATKFAFVTQLESVFNETPPAVQLLNSLWKLKVLLATMFYLDILIWFEGVIISIFFVWE